jgi:hypothetical protein
MNLALAPTTTRSAFTPAFGMDPLSHTFHNETQGFKVHGGARLADAWKLFAVGRGADAVLIAGAVLPLDGSRGKAPTTRAAVDRQEELQSSLMPRCRAT